MKIAYLAYNGSLHTRRWVTFFAQRGHDVQVVTCGDSDLSDAAPLGYSVRDLGAPRFGKLGYFLRVRAARSAVRTIAPDLVHAHFATSYGMLALATGVRPLVVTAHGDDVLISPRNPLLRPIIRRVLRAASLVTVPSEQMRSVVRTLAGADVDVVVLQYGVEVDRLTQVAAAERQPVAVPGAPIRIVSARPLLGLYRHAVLLDALALLRTRGVEWSCELYGDGPARSDLVQQAARLGIAGALTFHGRRPPEEVERALAAADICVSVAESDGASLALLEALALGPVPVLSDIPANRAWVRDGENGVLVPIAAKPLAEGIERAVRLDRAAVAAENRSIVAARADRARNLTLLEERLEEIVAAARAERRAPGVAG